MKATVTIEIDTEKLGSVTDSYLAQLWHVAQANPAPLEDHMAGRIAEAVGREIIKRWLKDVDPELYTHQGEHYYWQLLMKHGSFSEGGKDWVPDQTVTEEPKP